MDDGRTLHSAEVEEMSLQRKEYTARSYQKGIFVLLYSLPIIKCLMADFSLIFCMTLYGLTRWYMFAVKVTTLFPITAVTAVCSITSFLLVFYTNQVYSRYIGMFWLTNALQGRMLDVCLMIQSFLSIPEALRIYRYLNAAHILGYIGCTKTYTEDNLFVPFNEKYQLLTEMEFRRVKDIGLTGGSAYREILNWLLRHVQDLYKQKKISDMDKYILLDKVTAFRTAFGQLYDYQDNPIPFIYVNFTYWVSVLYPALFSVAIAMSHSATDLIWPYELIALLTVFVNTAFATGVRIIACKLLDPLGHDSEDFNLYHYISFITLASIRQLHSAPPPVFDPLEEMHLNDCRINIGSAFTNQYDGYQTKGVEVTGKAIHTVIMKDV